MAELDLDQNFETFKKLVSNHDRQEHIFSSETI